MNMRCPLFDYCSLSRCVGSGKITTEQLLAFLTSLNLLALFFFSTDRQLVARGPLITGPSTLSVSENQTLISRKLPNGTGFRANLGGFGRNPASPVGLKPLVFCQEIQTREKKRVSRTLP